MNAWDGLVRDREMGGKINSALWYFSVENQCEQAGWPIDYSEMAQEDIDNWLAWDKEWLESEDVREGYAVLMALEKL